MEFRDYGDWHGPNKLFEGFLQQRQIDQHRLQEAGVTYADARRAEDEELRESGSTSDFATYLNDKANKRLMWGYGEVSANWRRYARTYSVPDFKPQTFVRLTEMQDLLPVPEGGEYKDSEIGEIVGPSFSVDTYGRLFSLTRKAIINDDLNQLRDRPAAMGRAAARSVSKSIVGKLEAPGNAYDGVPVFDASHGNLLTSPLDETSLADAITKLRLQTDPNGNRIGLTPAFLLVPAQLELTTRRILTSTTVPQPYGTGGQATTPDYGRGNAHLSQLVQLNYAVENFLTDANDWYLFADPNEAPVLAVGFLNGKDTPDIFLRDPGMRNVLGGSDPYSMEFDEIVWKIRHEWGTGIWDWRGAVKSAVA